LGRKSNEYDALPGSGQPFKNRIEVSGTPATLLIGAVMRKLLPVAFGILKPGKPFATALHAACSR
jgi:hypothetical protein